MNYVTKFTATNDWLVTAILEKLLGRCPTHAELNEFLNITFDETTHENKIYYDHKLILESQLKPPNEEGGIEGFFNVPEELLDEFMKERIDTWMN